MRVPWSDCRFSKDEIEAVTSVLSSNWASRGKVSDEFEARLAKYLGSNVCLVNSGSSALMCALLAYGLRTGDRVLVPDFTFIATGSVPAILGYQITSVDCELDTFNVDLEPLKQIVLFLKQKTGVITTDVAGLPSNSVWSQFARAQIKDAAESLGSEISGIKVGAFNDLTCFSFQTTKNLSTVEGGAIASKNEEMIEKCRRIADYGRTSERYVHDILGMNMRITDIQSAIGLIQLEKLDFHIEHRKRIWERYAKEIPFLTPQKIPSYVTRSSYWMYLCLTDWIGTRDDLLVDLQNAGIDARKPWLPVSRQPCFPELHRSYRNNADEIYDRGLTLPIFNNMTDEQVDCVINTCNSLPQAVGKSS